ncbi:MAG: hypothetical protein IMF15_09645 [Proteobacteria bacterium]|nr:hypothetical protein [Pseudomonadota bacterium]
MAEYDHPVVSDAFDLLAKNTELSLVEYTSITKSQADIERYLMQHIGTISTVLYGAFSRKTITSPLPGSIIDMLVVYRGDEVKREHPSDIFARLCDVLIKPAFESFIIEGQNALMLPRHGFHFKIHPAYALAQHTYMLPDPNFNEWAKYDITSFNDIFVKENVRHKGKLTAMVRMVKTWNRVSGNLFNGYYLELMVTDVLSNFEITSYPEALCHIFRRAVAEVVFEQKDPANIEFEIEGLDNLEDVVEAMKLLKRSFKLAEEAIELEQENNTKKALENWNKLFPQVLPTQLDMIVGKARNSGIKGADALRMMIDQK